MTEDGVSERNYNDPIGLADYESKDTVIKGYLIQEKSTNKINFLIPSQKKAGTGDTEEAVMFYLEDGGRDCNMSAQPDTMIEILEGEKEHPAKDFHNLVEITPVEMSRESYVALAMAQEMGLFLSSQWTYVMSILRDKKKADSDIT